MNNNQTPSVTRVYQNHHLDSTRWDRFQPRDDDIIVTTSYKCGTTFTQQILWHMLHGHKEEMTPMGRLSPWLDARFDPRPIDDLLAGLEAQDERRFIKSHLPLDGLPYYPNVKYLVVARDPRDVFMSLINHYGNYTDVAYKALNGGDRVGDPIPRFNPDFKEAWTNWISRGWFEWESEGWPFWGSMHHVQSYWDYKHLPNFRFLHYADMRADLPGTIRSVAEFIGHEVSDADVERIAHATDFDTVKAKAAEEDAEADADAPRFFANGGTGFFFKGTNGRWRDILDDEDLALYEETKQRVLTPDCAAWLEKESRVPTGSE